MALLLYSLDDDLPGWRRELLARRPGLDVRVWPEVGDPAGIEAALVWLPPPGLLAGLPGLRAILSLGAGVEALLRDPTLPEGVPLCRMVDPGLTRSMAEYVLAHVLKYHRELDVYAAQQRRGVWRLRLPLPAGRRTVGVMGLGVLGAEAAGALARHGFRVKGWGRSPKAVDGVECHAGEAGLDAFLDGLDVLVCLLPLTPETEGVLSAGLFAKLPRGARLVNAGRGRHLVERDLLDALDAGRLAHATLDVAREEPPPPDHPFWRHPLVDLTPHVAAYVQPETGADGVLENLRRLEAGEPLLNVVDRGRGY